MDALLSGVSRSLRVACGISRKAVPIVSLAKCRVRKTDYPLYSLANNKEFYEYMNACHADDIFEYTSSLDSIIDQHNSELSILHEDITLGEVIGSGGYNTVYKTNDDSKVFRMLQLGQTSEFDAKYLKKGTSKPKLLIGDETITVGYTSLRELYGLIIQFYFTQKCVDHVCKVYDFGIMKNGKKSFAYAILEAAQLDMFALLHRKSQLSISVSEKITLDTFKKLWEDLFNAIKCIHHNGFVHLDIKPQNVGLIVKDDNITPILLDFGFASPIGSILCKKRAFGTAKYILPDFSEDTCREESDMFAYLIMISEALFENNKKLIATDIDKYTPKPLYYDLLLGLTQANKKKDAEMIIYGMRDLLYSIAPKVTSRYARPKSATTRKSTSKSATTRSDATSRSITTDKIVSWFNTHYRKIPDRSTSTSTSKKGGIYKYQKSRKNKHMKKQKKTRKIKNQ
jgi:serine/threonine protein kinase